MKNYSLNSKLIMLFVIKDDIINKFDYKIDFFKYFHEFKGEIFFENCAFI